MITITIAAGVRMAKAGKAMEQAGHDVDQSKAAMLASESCREEMKLMAGHPPLHAAYVKAEREWREAVQAVAAELYKQRLHEMTGP